MVEEEEGAKILLKFTGSEPILVRDKSDSSSGYSRR